MFVVCGESHAGLGPHRLCARSPTRRQGGLLSLGPLVARDAGQLAARQATLQLAEASFEPLPLDRAAARAFARVEADLRASGRRTTPRTFDALIAATATATANGPPYTANAEDLVGITELDVREVRPTG